MATALSSVIRNVIARHVRIFDADGNMANVDSVTEGLQTRDALKNMTNKGRVFVVSDLVTGLGNGFSELLLIRPDSQYSPRMLVEINADATVTARVYEGPDVSADGTELTPRNKNRNFSDNANTSFFDGPTIGAGGNGTIVVEQLVPTGGVGTVIGLDSVGEWVLDATKEYLVEIANDSGGVADTDITLSFFEERVDI